ncbi:MAG TPA: PLP-dependent aminotransferase family protein [Chloroflexota bacterium]|nr:PLP-dependent aminotransferase family protein [Chloroflexota bacterium]
MSFDWSASFANRVSRFQGSAVREMFHWATLPGMISLSAGSPAPELFPVESFRKAANQVLDEDPVGALQYGITEGYGPLREWIAEHMKSKGFSVTADEVYITTGSQQAMDLLVRVLIDKGDTVVVERPTFIATLQALDTCEAEFLSAPMDEQGMIVDELERRLEGIHAKLICAQPNFQNPSGVSMSLPRRMQLAHLARQRGIPIVEDDPYSELIYEGEALPSIKSFDTDGLTLYLGSFSKILMPGLRIGWVAGPVEVLEKMAVVKQSNDLHTDGYVQRIVNVMVRSGELPGHIEKLRTEYRARRDAMLSALERYFPAEATWTHPRGGLFVWVELPEGVNANDLMRPAVERLVLFPPGAGFYRDGSGQNTMRLNFSNQPPERIEEGVKRLGEVVKEHLASR